MAGEVAAEADLLLDLSARAGRESSSRLAKYTDSDQHLKMRKRGRWARRPPSGEEA